MVKKRVFLVVMLVLSCSYGRSQSVKELEQKLRFTRTGEPLGEKRQIALDVLAMDTYNATAIGYIVNQYFKAHQTDSIRVYLDNLIRLDPKCTAPYMIKLSFGNLISLTKADRYALLNKAYTLDSNDIIISYELAKNYTTDFHSDANVSDEKARTAVARKALFFCCRLYRMNSPYKGVAKYQILQFSRYLKDDALYKKYLTEKGDALFFDWASYAGLPKDWENKFDINVFSIMESVKDSYNYYLRNWLELGESSLMTADSIETIRFTLLRSFKGPIVIRIQNEQGLIRVYRKEVTIQEEKHQRNLVASNVKSLTPNDWMSLCKGLDDIQFWNMPSSEKLEGMMELDGDQWILEAKIKGVYKIVDRHNGGRINAFCTELLNKAN
jgi:hypothetical protein